MLRDKPRKLSLKEKQKIAKLCCERWEQENPNPQCELYYETPYQLLVSVVLSAQATDKIVNRTMKPSYQKGWGPQNVLKMGEEGFRKLIQSIGLTNTKARNVLRLTKKICEDYQGRVPNTREDLESLPGVGRKTANVILGELFRQPTLAVDTHVFRVSYRLGLQNEKTPEKAEHEILNYVDKALLPRAHHWFILHGRYTCKAKKPSCTLCILSDICPSYMGKPKKNSAKKTSV